MIERVQQKDWHLWRNLRLEALRLSAEAFGSSFEHEQHLTEVQWRMGLDNGAAFAFRDNGQFAGMGVFRQETPQKMRHRGGLYGMYVKPSHRGRGVGGQLVRAVVDEAKQHVIQIHCQVVTSNASAVRLYQRHAFTIYGTEPRTLRVAGAYFDEHLMVRHLDN